MTKLRKSAIAIKSSLSNSDLQYNEEVDIYFDDEELDVDQTITLKAFEEINKNLISRILSPIKEVESYAKIDKIITVGGSSYMLFVNREINKLFNKEPYPGVDPWEAVGLGAGMLAAKIIADGQIPVWMKDIKLTDICPFSIGTSNSDGKMAVLIKKNEAIPAFAPQKFRTVLYRQEEFYVDVLEGEEIMAKNNQVLGGFTIQNLPNTEKFLEFEITFSINKYGILSAKAELIGGNLDGSTSIDIKKVNHWCNRDKPNELFDGNNVHKIFYTNLQRFILFNMDSILKFYSKDSVQCVLNDIQYRMKHLDPNDVEFVDIDDYVYSFLEKYKSYFKVHQLPYFLGIYKGLI